MTRTRSPGGVTDHDLFVVQPHDHHPEVEHDRVQINGLSIPPGDYEHRITWTRDNHRVTEAVLAGPGVLVSGGHTGAWGMGSQTVAESNSRFVSGAGVYAYIASFSRLHGDTYLSSALFGTSIFWKDIYLDGDETVLLFTNAAAVNRDLKVWGLVTAK